MNNNFEQDKLKNFTVIRNEIIEDKGLSLKALGLAVFLLHLPPTWDFSVAGLSAVTKKGETSIKSTLKELEEKGYLKRRQSMKDGKFGHMIYTITDKLENRGFPSAENPPACDTPAQRRGQINTKETNTNTTSTNEISSSLRSEDIYTEFEKLWEMYPKKQGKKEAFKHYQKARKSGTTYEEVEKGINAYVNSIKANNKDMQYVKMGSTFFSQEAWKDDWSIRNGQGKTKAVVNSAEEEALLAEIFG